MTEVPVDTVVELLVTNSEVNEQGTLVVWGLTAQPIMADTTGKLRAKVRKYVLTLVESKGKQGKAMNTSDYAKDNPLCELTGQPAHHVHHIWGGKQRLDLRSNLIRLSASAHDLCHSEIVRGRCVCMMAKLAKGEFDISELDAAAGQSVMAWIERHKDNCGDSRRLWLAVQSLSVEK